MSREVAVECGRSVVFADAAISYARHQFPRAVIQHAGFVTGSGVERGRSVVFADAADLVCRHQFPCAVIQHAVWIYLRFTLSYRDVEDLLAEARTRRVLREHPPVGAEARAGHRPPPSARRPKPTTVGIWTRWWCGLQARGCILARRGQRGRVLDIVVQCERDKSAALKLMRKLLKKPGLRTDRYRDGQVAIVCSGLRRAWPGGGAQSEA